MQKKARPGGRWIDRYIDRYLPKDGVQHAWVEVPAGVDPLVLFDELLRADLHLGVGVVQRGVQHDDGERQDEAGVTLLRYIDRIRYLDSYINIYIYSYNDIVRMIDS